MELVFVYIYMVFNLILLAIYFYFKFIKVSICDLMEKIFNLFLFLMTDHFKNSAQLWLMPGHLLFRIRENAGKIQAKGPKFINCVSPRKTGQKSISIIIISLWTQTIKNRMNLLFWKVYSRHFSHFINQWKWWEPIKPADQILEIPPSTVFVWNHTVKEIRTRRGRKVKLRCMEACWVLRSFADIISSVFTKAQEQQGSELPAGCLSTLHQSPRGLFSINSKER